MIKEVLRAIREGGLLSKGYIAERAGVQESTLESILSMFSDKGYLMTVYDATELSRGCARCPMIGQCMQKASTGNVYVITEKGKKLLEIA